MGRNFKKNKVKVDLASYPLYLIQGVPKVGKTSLMYELAEYVYGDTDKMMLQSILDEDGYNHLDDITVEEANHWLKVPKKDLKVNPDELSLMQNIDDIVENNDEYGFKMFVFDTFDKLAELSIKEVKRLHQESTGTPCKSLNDALGGYGKGRDKALEIMLEAVGKLRKAGIAVFVLSHTKFKNKTDIILDQQYEVLTTALRDDFYNCFANIAQMIVTINVEREIDVEGRETGVKDQKTGKKKGVLKGSTRMMHFRSDGTVDCGCRFKDIPEKLELSAENFMLAFETGVKSNMKSPATDKDIEKMRKEELENLERIATLEKTNNVDLEKNEKMLAEISKLFVSANPEKKASAKELVGKYGLKGFKDTNFPTADIEEILNVLK